MTNPWKFPDFPSDVENIRRSSWTLSHGDLPVPAWFDRGTDLKLPNLETFEYGPLEEISAQSESIASETTSIRDIETSEEDFWSTIPFEQYDASTRSRTWEQLGNETFHEPNIYLSEASQGAWNAIWAGAELRDTVDVIQTLKPDHAIRCLIDLGMGLDSDLFTIDGRAQVHPRAVFAFQGLSSELSSSIMRTIGCCGQSFHAIGRLTSPDSRQEHFPRSMGGAISVARQVLMIVRQHLVQHSGRIITVLELQDLFKPSAELLSKLEDLLRDLQKLKDEKSFINHLVHMESESTMSGHSFHQIVLQILRQSVQPLLEEVSQVIGLLPPQSTMLSENTLLHVQEGSQVNDSHLRIRKLPDIFDDGQEQIVRHIQQSLGVLKAHRSTFAMPPIAQFPDQSVQLELAVSWDAIDVLETKARKYDSLLRGDFNSGAALVTERQDATKILNHPPIDPYIIDSMLFDAGSTTSVDTNNTTTDDHFASVVLSSLRKDLSNGISLQMHTPLLELAAESFRPLLDVQSRYINHSCMKMLFGDCDLLHHFDVLYQYNLLGSGLFTTNLKQALFSSELPSAERKKGYYRGGQLGLRLGSRSTWPPASAELRLALMGVMSACYDESFPDVIKPGSDHLPGGMSFSIRNLTEPEIQACLDPSSLEALDFLRIQYEPDRALAGILHDTALSKYDIIFKFLLRLSRVSFELDQMRVSQIKARRQNVKQVHRFYLEAQHFVQTLVAYAHSTIATTWNRFHSIITSMKNSLEHGYASKTLFESTGMFQITALHDTMLKDIMSDLLLRHRHAKAMHILEDVLSSILQNVTGGALKQEAISQYRANAALFFTTCQDLLERDVKPRETNATLPDHLSKMWSNGKHSDRGLRNLLFSLDMNGWYSRHALE